MYSIQKLNSLADQLEEDGIVGTDKAANLAEPGDILAKAGEIYHKIRPFLEFFSGAFFVPKKWRTVIVTFLMTLDGLFPEVVEQ